MAEKSSHDATFEELQRMRQEEDTRLFPDLSPLQSPSKINESLSSTAATTPDPLNTAFINDTTVNEEQYSPLDLSKQQSQTTNEALSSIHGLISTIVKQDHENIDLCSPTKTSTLTSTGTMPKTPTMISTGTMPKTPTMISTGTMPKTPTMKSTGTMPKTPTMISTGTMPKTPTMKSTGTMPETPTMISTGAMPKTPPPPPTTTTTTTTTTTALSVVNETIDLVSPTIETIDLSSPDTPTTNTDNSNITPYLAPH